MKIVWSPIALERMHEIAQFIAEDKPSAAKKWIRLIFKHAEKLQRYPKSGRWVEEVNRPDIMEIVVGQYRVIYRLEEKQVAILTVRHARQMLRSSEIVIAKDIQLPDQPPQGLVM